MPIGNFAQLARFSKACGAEIPRWLEWKMQGYGDDAESVRALGLDVVTSLCERLLAHGAPGLHFYTMNQAGILPPRSGSGWGCSPGQIVLQVILLDKDIVISTLRPTCSPQQALTRPAAPAAAR